VKCLFSPVSTSGLSSTSAGWWRGLVRTRAYLGRADLPIVFVGAVTLRLQLRFVLSKPFLVFSCVHERPIWKTPHESLEGSEIEAVVVEDAVGSFHAPWANDLDHGSFYSFQPVDFMAVGIARSARS